jgi:hypothetical protein
MRLTTDTDLGVRGAATVTTSAWAASSASTGRSRGARTSGAGATQANGTRNSQMRSDPPNVYPATKLHQQPHAPEPEVVGGYRLGAVRHVFADAGRATARLGFTARESFTAGLRELSDELVVA